MRSVHYFLLGVAFFTFSGLAADLSTYSSGWWRRQVLHIFATSFFDICIGTTANYLAVAFARSS